ncbi:MAG: hypothetical protein J1F12_09230, partial [Muribaculaceae bacterium]|nr:hypothetical protein [Muribaculaceae bacterium]
TAGQHHLREERIGSDFLRYDGADAAGTDDQGFTHVLFTNKWVYRFTVAAAHSPRGNLSTKIIVLFC